MDDAMLPYRLPRSKVQANLFAEGRLLDVSSAGARFTVPEWDGGKHVFGPAPWPLSRVEPAVVGVDGAHDHEATVPPRGARVLVLFLGAGVERPWILGWWA